MALNNNKTYNNEVDKTLVKGLMLYLAITASFLGLISILYLALKYSWHRVWVDTLVLLPPMAANGSATLTKTIKAKINGKPYDSVILHRIDRGRTLWGSPLLGEGKTWEGFTLGSIAGFITTLLFLLPAERSGIEPSFYFTMGVYSSVAALLGDMCGSFIKRRMGKPRGYLIPLLDQADFYTGAVLVIYLLGYRMSIVEAFVYFLLVYSLHIITNCIAYRMGKKNECP